jgi:exopolysaccharide biosynthesis polyprenyl glycosylphosphotransferase
MPMTQLTNTKGALLLAVGDFIAFIFSLVLTLAVRYGEIPSGELLNEHLPSFIFLSIIFILVHFSAGLYDKQSSIVRTRVQRLLLRAQIVNALIGVVFFYFVSIDIAPKTNLFIYFVISTILLFIWRTVMFPVFSLSRKQPAILLGNGKDIQDLYEEVNGNERYGLFFARQIKPAESVHEMADALRKASEETGAAIVVADLHDPKVDPAVPVLYKLIFSGAQIIDASRLYETIFDRVPISMLGERWLIENSATALGNRRLYDILKRAMDICLGGIAAIISLIVYPFVWAAIKSTDGGPVFITQKRVGQNGKLIKMTKFRSMTADDAGVYNKEGKTEQRVTKVGAFIRLTRIDELPQLWSVIKGDQSLIGPRPELPALAQVYEKEIPYYNVRHLIKPGLSGWAQITHEAHPHHVVVVDETRDKLSYDLFYIKNRSFLLDIRIALQTLKAILSKQGV